MKEFTAAILVTAVLSLSGCASIMHGTTQSVGISSIPSGASVSVDGQSFGTTPAFANLSRKNQHVVSIAMPGYLTQDLTLTKSVSGWVWGNIVFGGFIGLAVDAVSGGLYKLSPEQMVASLDKKSSARIGDTEVSMYIQLVLKPDDDWQKIGSLQSTDFETAQIPD